MRYAYMSERGYLGLDPLDLATNSIELYLVFLRGLNSPQTGIASKRFATCSRLGYGTKIIIIKTFAEC